MSSQTSEIVLRGSKISCLKNISSLRPSSAKSAKSKRIAASRIRSYLQGPYASVPYATIVKNPQASVHKQFNRVAAAGYRMGAMLEEFDKAFDGNNSGGNNNSNDRSNSDS